MRWALDEHGIQRFIVTISPDNVASLRLADRFGFRKIDQHVDDVGGDLAGTSGPGDGVGLEAGAVVDVHHVHLLVFADVRGLEQVRSMVIRPT
jgi:hypothetical protein